MNFFLLLLGSAPAYLAQYLTKFLPPDLQLMLFGFAKSFYTIVSYHLMGYVILQYSVDHPLVDLPGPREIFRIIAVHCIDQGDLPERRTYDRFLRIGAIGLNDLIWRLPKKVRFQC